MRAFIKWSLAGPVRRKSLLVLAAILVAVIWRLAGWGMAWESRKLADDLASVGVFVGPAIPNHAFTQVLFAQNTEIGVGIYTADLRTGVRRQVYEIAENRILSGTVGNLGWAPDDTVFAYTKPAKGRKQDIVVCSGFVGAPIDYFKVDSVVTSFAWVSANLFAYANRDQEIRIVGRDRKGKWAERVNLGRRGGGPIEGLAVFGQSSIAWQEGKSIYRMGLASREPELLFESEQAARLDFACGRERNTLVIGIAGPLADYTVLSLYAGPPRVTNFVHEFREQKITGVRMINGGRGYALVCAQPAGRSLLVSSEGEPANKPLLAGGNVQYATPQGRKLYIAGCTNVEPPGIWEYDCKDGALRCVLAGSERGESLYRTFRHQAGVLEIGGREVTYRLWMPEPTIFRRKFPLIIGQTPYGWSPYPYIAVNAGYCFVTVDRPSWYEGLDTWGADVMGVYEHLKSNVHVDARAGYLYGRSAETPYLSAVAAENPQLWKGAVLFSPGTLPDLSLTSFSKVFVDLGEYDKGARERLTKYQAQAAARGVPVRLLVHETARHTSWSRATQRARLENLAEFLETQ
jgi:hypothetical protein